LLLLFIICCSQCRVVKTNAAMSRFRILCHSEHTYSNLGDRDQPTSQTDRQTENTTVHRMVMYANTVT